MAANVPDATRILSVQSHVVSGYVGNRSATFPLQLLGWDVDVANTVQFSNHTGYGRWQGLRFDAEHLRHLFEALEINGLLRYSRMLTGYMPSAPVVETVLQLVKKLRSRQAGLEGDLIYLLDPVMGDMDRGMYVVNEVIPVYKQLLPYSTIITPNQFEAQILTGIDIVNFESLKQVMLTLHKLHKVPHVIITSVQLPHHDLTLIGAQKTLEDGRPAMLQVGSSCNMHLTANGERQPEIIQSHDLHIWMIQFPQVDGYFSGVGDMFAALVLGRFQPTTVALTNVSSNPTELETKQLTPIAKASELAIASLQAILANTCKVIQQLEYEHGHADASNLTANPVEQQVEMMRRRELRVVQSKSDIENPTIVYRAKWIS